MLEPESSVSHSKGREDVHSEGKAGSAIAVRSVGS